jgi:hypothetical protein
MSLFAGFATATRPISARNSGVIIFGWLYPIGHVANCEKKSRTSTSCSAS